MNASHVLAAVASSQNLLSEGKMDSGPFWPVELPGEVCVNPDDAMILCDNCNRDCHTTCVHPCMLFPRECGCVQCVKEEHKYAQTSRRTSQLYNFEA